MHIGSTPSVLHLLCTQETNQNQYTHINVPCTLALPSMGIKVCQDRASTSVTEVLTRVSSSRLPNEVRTGPAKPGAPPDAAARTCAFDVHLLQTRLCGALTGAVPRFWQVFLSCSCGQDNATSGGTSRRCGGGQGTGAWQTVCRQAHRRALRKLGSCSGTTRCVARKGKRRSVHAADRCAARLLRRQHVRDWPAAPTPSLRSPLTTRRRPHSQRQPRSWLLSLPPPSALSVLFLSGPFAARRTCSHAPDGCSSSACYVSTEVTAEGTSGSLAFVAAWWTCGCQIYIVS